jgi:hypothetical protein
MPAEVVDILKMVWPLIVLQFALEIWALVDLARRPKVRHLPKVAWVILILFVNFFGAIGYLVFGREEA